MKDKICSRLKPKLHILTEIVEVQIFMQEYSASNLCIQRDERRKGKTRTMN